MIKIYFNKDLLHLHGDKDCLILTESLGLSQLVTQPTRVTNNSTSLIDHIYPGDEENLSKVHVCQIGISDHFAVFCNRKINASLKKNSHKSIKYRSFKHFDEINFLHDLQLVPWSNIDEFENMDDKLEAWYAFFTDTINKHAPVKTHRIKNHIQPDWLTADILDKMKERDKLKKHGDFEKYKELRNQISSLIEESKKKQRMKPNLKKEKTIRNQFVV